MCYLNNVKRPYKRTYLLLKLVNYPSGVAPNYPRLPHNTYAGAPAYYPPGNINLPAGSYPQYPANAPYPNPGAGYGYINARNKRQTISSKGGKKTTGKSSKNNKAKAKFNLKDSDPTVHWGVHRILSTGMFI